MASAAADSGLHDMLTLDLHGLELTLQAAEDRLAGATAEVDPIGRGEDSTGTVDSSGTADAVGTADGLSVHFRAVHLDHNRLGGVPRALGLTHFAGVTDLALHSCELTALPDSIAVWLPALESLRLDHNDIAELPDSITQMGKLHTLHLDGNKRLRRLPEAIGDLRNLADLGIGSSPIEELPPSMAMLSNLMLAWFSDETARLVRNVPQSVIAAGGPAIVSWLQDDSRALLKVVLANKNYSAWSNVVGLAVHACAKAYPDTTVDELVIPMRTDHWDADVRNAAPPSNGRLPALWVSDCSTRGVCVTDSLAICETLAEMFPRAKLWPAERLARARARSVVCEIHSSFMQVRTLMPYNWRRDAAPLCSAHGRAVHGNLLRLVDVWSGVLASEPTERDGGEFLFGPPTLADIFSAHFASRFASYCIEESVLSDLLCELETTDGPKRATVAELQTYLAALRTRLPGIDEWGLAAEKEVWHIPDFEVCGDGAAVSTGSRPVAD